MASSRVAHVVAGGVVLFAAGAFGELALASCGTQPGPSTLMTLQASYFGRIGKVNQPFLVATDFVELSPEGCATGASFDAASPPRTVIVVDQTVAGPDSSGKKRLPSVLIIEPDADEKKCEALKKACRAEIKNANLKAHEVECAAASQAVLSTTLLRLALPDVPKKLIQPTGRSRIAVRDKTKATGCGALVADDACKKLPVGGNAGWHVCVDDLFESTSCAPSHPTFPTLTTLPPWNEFNKMCFEQHCQLDEKRSLTYAVDSDGNMLVPVNWSTLLGACPGNPATCEVSGALVAPSGTKFDIPLNSSATQSEFLESFSQAGEPNAPMFVADFSVPKGVAAVVGTTDLPFSVLRIHATAQQCFEDATGNKTGKRCGRGGSCPQGTTCHSICVGSSNPGDRCDVDQDCQGGRCRNAHDIKYSNKTGQWFLERKPRGLCQASSISKTCSVASECSAPSVCVQYQLRAVNPTTKLGPAPTPSPGPALVESFAEFIRGTVSESLSGFVKQLAGDSGSLRMVRSPESTWVAGYLAPAERQPTETMREDVGGSRSLVVARSECGNGAAFCDSIPVVLDAPLVPGGVAFVGGQLRVLSREPLARTADGAGVEDSRIGTLWVLDPSHASPGVAVEPTRVGRVVIGNPGYDPLRDPSGGTGTRYLSPAGRCFLGETPLGVPSYCRPGKNDCPDSAICREQDVVVAIDLRSDLDGDGVPDVLQQRGR